MSENQWTNTRLYADRELNTLLSIPDADKAIVEDFVPEILALCEKFGRSGQSGGSASFYASELGRVIKLLCMQEPICPIQNTPDEWVPVAHEDAGELFQNIRCGAMFKVGVDGRPYYLDAIVFKDSPQGGYTGTAKLADGTTVYSRQYIKSFPFTPKTFYVDVDDNGVATGRVPLPKSFFKMYDLYN